MTYINQPPRDRTLSQLVDEHGSEAPLQVLEAGAEAELARIVGPSSMNNAFRRGLGVDNNRTLFVGLHSNWIQWMELMELPDDHQAKQGRQATAQGDQGFATRMRRLGVHVGPGVPPEDQGSWMDINWADLGRCLTNAAYASMSPTEPRLRDTGASQGIASLNMSGAFWSYSAPEATTQHTMPIGVLHAKNSVLIDNGGLSARFLVDAQRLSAGAHRAFSQCGSLVTLNEEVLLLRERMRARVVGRALPGQLNAENPLVATYNHGMNVLEEVQYLLSNPDLDAHVVFGGLNAICAWHMVRSDLNSAKIGMHMMNILAVRARARGVRWMAVNDLNLILSSNLPLLTALVPLVEHDILQLRFLENTHLP